MIGVHGDEGKITLNENSSLSITNFGDYGKFAAIKLKPDNSIHFIRDFETQMIINKDGNVGIGMLYPKYSLDICGTVRASELRVNLTGCDFVFDKSYKLMSLSDLEKYIQENKHLPDIAPAKGMETEDGVKVGEMQSKLLQKIEELTLYIIEQNKKMEELEIKIDKLEKNKK